jgi:nucleoside-diphosphate-sugar epimerase
VKVFITGANGFIGRALAERYRTEFGAEVRGMDLTADPAAGVVAGDVREAGAWQEHAAGCDLVLHTAAVVSMRLERADDVWRCNVLGTRNALEAAERGGAQRFVHFSSVTVFGFDFPDGVDERYPVHPNGVPYVDTKVAAEQVVLQAHAEGRIPVTVVRPGDVYGPGSRAWAVLPVELIRARRFSLPDGGRGIFSPVYVDNLVDGVAAAAGAPEAAGQVLTLTDGVGITNAEYFGRLAGLIGRKLVTMPTPVALAVASGVRQALRFAPGDNDINAASLRYMLRRGTYSNAKARELLGWQPRVGIQDGLDRTCAWLREAGHA